MAKKAQVPRKSSTMPDMDSQPVTFSCNSDSDDCEVQGRVGARGANALQDASGTLHAHNGSHSENSVNLENSGDPKNRGDLAPCTMNEPCMLGKLPQSRDSSELTHVQDVPSRCINVHALLQSPLVNTAIARPSCLHVEKCGVAVEPRRQSSIRWNLESAWNSNSWRTARAKTDRLADVGTASVGVSAAPITRDIGTMTYWRAAGPTKSVTYFPSSRSSANGMHHQHVTEWRMSGH